VFFLRGGTHEKDRLNSVNCSNNTFSSGTAVVCLCVVCVRVWVGGSCALAHVHSVGPEWRPRYGEAWDSAVIPAKTVIRRTIRDTGRMDNHGETLVNAIHCRSACQDEGVRVDRCRRAAGMRASHFVFRNALGRGRTGAPRSKGAAIMVMCMFFGTALVVVGVETFAAEEQMAGDSSVMSSDKKTRRVYSDWGAPKDVELCQKINVMQKGNEAFFEKADADKDGLMSFDEWVKACTDYRKDACKEWEDHCKTLLTEDACKADQKRTCQLADDKEKERIHKEKIVFYEMGSRPVISADDKGTYKDLNLKDTMTGGLFVNTKTTSGDGKITLAEFKEPIVPYISGLWKFTYEYNEMTGPLDNKETNPCYGPFPYRYTWNIYIWQKVENINGTRRTTGDIRVCNYDLMDCTADSYAWTIIEGNKDLVDTRCRFRAYDEHPSDWFRFPGYRQGGYQKQLQPTDKDAKPLPVRLWNAFKSPNHRPWVWGIFCEQFSWYEKKTTVKNTPMPLYEGAWRHDNETWIIVREISTCPCFPACAECEHKIRGTQIKQVLESDGGKCLAKYGTVASKCEYVIRGVSGGPVRYPPETTQKEKQENGDDQVCFQYANIYGKLAKDASFLPEIKDDGPKWKGMGVPSENTNPLL
jgi:hypothetical protein